MCIVQHVEIGDTRLCVTRKPRRDTCLDSAVNQGSARLYIIDCVVSTWWLLSSVFASTSYQLTSSILSYYRRTSLRLRLVSLSISVFTNVAESRTVHHLVVPGANGRPQPRRSSAGSKLVPSLELTTSTSYEKAVDARYHNETHEFTSSLGGLQNLQLGQNLLERKRVTGGVPVQIDCKRWIEWLDQRVGIFSLDTTNSLLTPNSVDWIQGRRIFYTSGQMYRDYWLYSVELHAAQDYLILRTEWLRAYPHLRETRSKSVQGLQPWPTWRKRNRCVYVIIRWGALWSNTVAMYAVLHTVAHGGVYKNVM